MKNKNVYVLEVVVSLLWVFAFSGCLSTGVQPRAASGTLILQSTENQFGAVVKIFTVPKNDTEYEVRSIYWFSNWRDGWTEVLFPATGSLSVQRIDKQPPVVHVITPLEIENPEHAALRYQDTFLEGDRALTQMTNRWTRITEAVTWLVENGLGYEDVEPVFFCMGKGSVPAKDYPAIPEEFEEIIRTGTFMRDWKEGSPLFRFALDLPLTETAVSKMEWKKEK